MEQPDILGLLEVDAKWIAVIGPISREYKYQVEYPHDNHEGLALFSKMPVLESDVAGFAESTTSAIVGNIATGSDDFELILAHPPRPMSPCLAAARNAQLQAIVQHVRLSDRSILLAGGLNTTMQSPY